MRQKFHKSFTNVGFRSVWKLTKLTPCLVLVAGCGDVSGQREPPPPPPAIGAGTYSTMLRPNEVPHHTPSWNIDLPQGGRSRQARVQRCAVGCVAFRLPVRAGLNGLAISVPVSPDGDVDLAIAATETGLRLFERGPEGLEEWQLEKSDDRIEWPENLQTR